ncbi:MAG: PKD domain-containing protein [Candidatus Marithrix sp.]
MINTSSKNWGVNNDGLGNLSGYAWSGTVGWINFNPSKNQVTINTDGEFNGYAWGANIGWINFNDNNFYKVVRTKVNQPPKSNKNVAIEPTVIDDTGLENSTVTDILKIPPVAKLNISPIEGEAPLTVTLDGSNSTDSDGIIEDYTWASDGQEASGINAEMTFNREGIYDITLTVTDNDGLTDTQQDSVNVASPLIIESTSLSNIEFKSLKNFYQVGEKVEVEIYETVNRDKNSRVDLWIAIELPDGNFIYRTNLPLMPWSYTQQPHNISIENTETSHHIFDFELLEGMGGNYTLYAVYAKEGENPVTNGFSIRSNLAMKGIVFSNRKD